jgi:hypothetical protein
MVAIRYEPGSIQDLEATPEYNACREMFRSRGWHKCFEKFRGHDSSISLLFAQGFDRRVTRFRDIVMEVTEQTIAAATGLPQTGEKWFKKQNLPISERNWFLKKKYHDADWSKGVPRAWLKEEWKKPLIFLQRYLTCEGRYNLTFTYHIRILQHFAQGKEMNFPYFLWRSLKKMCEVVKRSVVNPEQHLFHHGLIKLLIVTELKVRKNTWNNFIAGICLRLEERQGVLLSLPELKGLSLTLVKRGRSK